MQNIPNMKGLQNIIDYTAPLVQSVCLNILLNRVSSKNNRCCPSNIQKTTWTSFHMARMTLKYLVAKPEI